MERGGPQHKKKFCLSTLPHGKLIFSDFAPPLETLDRRTLNVFFLTTKSQYGYESENSTPQVIQISKSKHNLDLNDEFHD